MATTAYGAGSSQLGDQWVALNAWNQLAPRAYNRFVLCFEVDNDRHLPAISYLRFCISEVGHKRPVLKSLLQVEVPIALIVAGQQNIPIEVRDIRQQFGRTYADLKEAGFPASAFVNDVFEVPAGSVIQALVLRIYVIDGGILLGIHLHHSLGDGAAIDLVISWLSAATRGDRYDTNAISLASPFCIDQYPPPENSLDQRFSPDYIKQNFPERILLSSPLCQLPVERSMGKIFVFNVATLNTLKAHIQKLEGVKRLSTTVILIAYVWAHATKARIAASRQAGRSICMPYGQANDGAENSKLMTIVDTRKRVFDGIGATQYFGNASEAALGSLPIADLFKMCERRTDVNSGVLPDNLGTVVRCIQESIKGVNVDFVRKRYKVYSRLSDPQKLAYDISPDDKHAFMFNSWRYFGMNDEQEWRIPGLKGTRYPDRIRRAGGRWNTPAAMLIPGRPDSEELEVMITIEERALELLIKDEIFTSLTTRIVS
ncbi:hypothetical protein GGR50DRAFT_653663 [Xylaria sp. CBS 124048]|nr:hypothetical protein GGR50DRAFT_653663 [Xylaria sp. CBS 124048]